MDDSADPAVLNVLITAGAITGLAPAEIDFTPAELSAITIATGTRASTWTIQNPGVPVTLTGPGIGSLVIDNSADTSSNTCTITSTFVQWAGSAPYFYGNPASLEIEGGSGNDTYDVQSTAAGTSTVINMGSGNDVANVGDPANPLDGIAGPLTLIGNGTGSALVLNDTAATTGQIYSLYADHFTRVQWGTNVASARCITPT